MAYWRYPQVEEGPDAAPNGYPNEHRAWQIVRRLRVENTVLQDERDWWRQTCYALLSLAFILASVLVMVAL